MPTHRISRVVLILLAALAASVRCVSATPIVIDFGTGFGGAGGTVNIDPSNNITGSGIFIDTVTIIGASVNNGVFDVEGAGVCGDAVGGCGLLAFDKNLNTITIVGSIPALGILAPVNLISGDLLGGVNVLINNGVTGALTMSGFDTKAQALLDAIGGNVTGDPFHFFGFETAVNGTGQGSPYTAISTDITNSNCTAADPGCALPTVNTVPEPATLVLIGSGLVAVVRRRNRLSLS